MADLLFGFPCVRQRWAQIYRFNDSILIYSNQNLRIRCRFSRASIELNTNLVEADLQRKTNCCYVLKPIDQVLIALQFYATDGLLQVVGDTTGVHKVHISLAVHSGRHIGNNHSAHSREIALWDTNCRLARQNKWFLHHVLTVNQWLTILTSNRALILTNPDKSPLM